MQLPVQSFAAMVQQMAATLQGTAVQLIDLTVGSVLRALLEASASVALWLQWMILQVLTLTRAATSVGPDLDSWMADFSFSRLPAVAATGTVTFSRYNAGLATVIPVQTIVRATQGLQTFSVTASPSNPAWNGSNGYILAANALSVDVPVIATVAGANGNVQSGAIGLLATPIIAVDYINNALPTTGGMDAETDAALRVRFQLYINSRSLATITAVASAVMDLQQGLRYAILENETLGGQRAVGNFCVVVDDGTGNPNSGLLANVQAAVDAVRPIGSTFTVNGPVIVNAAIQVVLDTSSVTTHAAVASLVQSNIAIWIASLPIAGTLAISKIDAIAHDTDLSVVSVTSTLINGASADLIAPVDGVIIAASIVVS